MGKLGEPGLELVAQEFHSSLLKPLRYFEKNPKTRREGKSFSIQIMIMIMFSMEISPN